MASNKRRRHTPDQIIRKLAEGNKLLGAGQELSKVCRHLQTAESTWHRWIAQYGGMNANEAKQLKELGAETLVSKKLAADQALDIDMLKEISAGNFLPRTVSAAPSSRCANADLRRGSRDETIETRRHT
uniref:Transposase IS3/IS911 family protein n=1 Tax=Mycolicibacterium gilvum (strain PYR-GCK) TaxID=350054 RepID=A4TEU8_MYCGI|nr:transposase IS3/IS911 family protein [Mycolicibacterium gilvum PYR-GCK]